MPPRPLPKLRLVPEPIDRAAPRVPGAPDLGEPRTVAEVARTHGKAMWAAICRMRHGRTDGSDDLCQEALLKVHQNLDKYDRSRPMWPWLFTVCANVVNDAARYAERHHAEEPVELDLEQLEEAGLSPEEKAVVTQQVGRFLDRLSVVDAAVFYQSEVEGRGYQEIADATGVALNTVRSKLHRMRKAFAADLDEPVESGVSAEPGTGDEKETRHERELPSEGSPERRVAPGASRHLGAPAAARDDRGGGGEAPGVRRQPGERAREGDPAASLAPGVTGGPFSGVAVVSRRPRGPGRHPPDAPLVEDGAQGHTLVPMMRRPDEGEPGGSPEGGEAGDGSALGTPRRLLALPGGRR